MSAVHLRKQFMPTISVQIGASLIKYGTGKYVLIVRLGNKSLVTPTYVRRDVERTRLGMLIHRNASIVQCGKKLTSVQIHAH